MQPCKKRIELFLKDRSEIVYLYPSIACLIIFIVTIISSSVYITQKRNYQICLAEISGQDDYLRQYNIGSIIIGYIFLGIYSNILIEYIPQLKGLAISFAQLLVWTLGTIIWNIIGISLVSKSHCTSSSYYGIAIFNLVVFFTSVFLLICYSLYVLIRPVQKLPNPQNKVQSAPQETPALPSAKLNDPKITLDPKVASNKIA